MNEPFIQESRFQRLLAAGLVWPVVAILLFCLALVYQGVIAGSYRDGYLAAQVRDTKARELRTELLDMDTGVRGYLLTGEGPYLEPYTRAEARLNQDLEDLIVDCQDDAFALRTAKDIEGMTREWQLNAHELIGARSKGSLAEDQLLAVGRREIDDLQKDYHRFLDSNANTMRQRHDAWVNQRFQVLMTLIVGGIVVAAIITCVVLLLLRRLARMYHAVLLANEASGQQVKELNADLEHRVRDRTNDLIMANQELEAFSYSVSHDLRAPLRSVASFSAIIQQDVGDKLDPETVDNLRRIRAAAAKMGALIDALLKFSRIARSELNRSRVDVSQLAQSILSDLAREPGTFETSVQPGLVADADPHLLRVVLENLLENARKFSAKEAEPRIEVGMESGAFFVRDNGVGFDQQYVEKVFLPFERLHKDGDFPGTGIGLATTRRIVERHGGRIWAESVVNGGTTFHFTMGRDEDIIEEGQSPAE